MGVLKPEGRWSVSALESVVGKPEDYAFRVSRLLLVVPEVTTQQFNIETLDVLLADYTFSKDLRVEVWYHIGKLDSNLVSAHGDVHAEHVLVITVMNKDTLRATVSEGLHPFQEALSAVRLHYVTDSGPMPDRSLSLKLNQLLSTGGHLELDPRVDPVAHPYNMVWVFTQGHSGGARHRRRKFAIVRAAGA
jgi:hypothetical protein